MRKPANRGLPYVLIALALIVHSDSHPDERVAHRIKTGHRSSAAPPFIPNVGQWSHPARFVHCSGALSVFVEDRGWLLGLAEREPDHPRAHNRTAPPNRDVQRGRTAAVRMTFTGHGAPELTGEDPGPGVHHYFVGDDPNRWRTDVPLYTSVLYRGMHPGVDVRLRSADGHPEYDLLLQPGADLDGIAVRVDGARGLLVAADGALVIQTALGPLTQPPPTTWEQVSPRETRIVRCAYRLLGPDVFGFAAPAWNRERALTIDPGLVWSTFLGGPDNDWDPVLAADGSGVVTVASRSLAPNYPTTPGAYSAGWTNFSSDIAVSRLDPRQAGAAQLLWSTFIGGTDNDLPRDLWVDADGVVTITGSAGLGFPTTPDAFAQSYGGGWSDGCIVRFDPRQSGNAQLTYSTYLGGDGQDYLYGVAVDAAGVVTVGGLSYSTAFPTTPGAYRSSPGGAFVSQLDPSRPAGAQLVYSTLIANVYPRDIAVEPSGLITIAGTTYRNVPVTPGAYSTTYNGSDSDCFVLKMDPSATGPAQLAYATYLGGDGDEVDEAINAVVVDDEGVVTVTGFTESDDFPTTPGAFARTHNGYFADAFVSRLDPRLQGNAQLVYSTLMGSRFVEGKALYVDPRGVVTIAGQADSWGFPTTPGAYQATNGEAFVSRFDPRLQGVAQLVYSTLLGGGGGDEATTLAVDRMGVVTVAGNVRSTSFPTTPDAYATSRPGARDVFVARLDMLPSSVTPFGASTPGCNGPMAIGVISWPGVGNTAFAVTCSNAPANGVGLFALAALRHSNPFPALSGGLWVNIIGGPSILRPVTASASGSMEVPLPVPLNPWLVDKSLHAQFLWATATAPLPCPPLGLAASNAITITVHQ